ncbi:MAG: DUF4388 domain-containing protein [Actinobacteria bacterium]|nr:DUF4388 domain-containing protein [Actinomycetota bacterium]
MLKGSLEEFPLSDIFRLIAGARKTGRLEITRRAGSGGVYFRNGEIYFAESSVTREPLGQKLVRAGVLSERDLMKALDEHAASGMRVGEVLVRNGAIDKSQLAVAIRSQVQDAASDCLKWEVGEFEFESSSEVVAEIPIRVSVDYVIMEASRLIDDVAGTERKLRSRKMILRRVADISEAKTNLRLSTGEERIFLLVNGERPISEIIGDADSDELDVLRTLHGLLASGMIEVVPDALREPEPIAYSVDPAKAAAAVSAAVEETGFSSDAPAPTPRRTSESGAVQVEEAPPVTEEIQVDQPEIEIDFDSIEPETKTSEVSIGEDAEDEPVPFRSEAEAEISSIASTPPPAPPAPRVEAPEPVEEWFEDPELKRDQVDLTDTEDAVSAVVERHVPAEDPTPAPAEMDAPTEASARIQPPQPPAAEIREVPAYETQPEPAPAVREIPSYEAPQEAAPPEVRYSTPQQPAMRIDRAVVVRELASLFGEDDTPAPAPRAARPDEQAPRHLEDDDDVDRGLIHRLIDGVKGL